MLYFQYHSILSNYSGYRAPFLQMGANEQFTAMKQDGLLYDCSWVSRDYGYLDLGIILAGWKTILAFMD